MADIKPSNKPDNHEALLMTISALGSGGVSVEQLSKLIGRNRSTVYRIINFLEEQYSVVIDRNVYDKLVIRDPGVFNLARIVQSK